MNDYKLFIQRLGLIGITNILISISSIILLPVLTKILSVEEYGIWVQITVTVNLIPAISTFGLSEAMLRFLSPLKDKKIIAARVYSIIILSILSSLIVTVLIYLFSPWISLYLFNGESDVLNYFALTIFFACLNYILLNYFRTFNMIKLYSIFNLILTYLTIVLVAYFIFSGMGITGAVFGLLITYILIFLVMLLIVLYQNGIVRPSFIDLVEYLLFGLPTIPGNLSYWAVNSSDRYIISFILGASFVGYYSPGYALGSLLSVMYAPLSFLLPSILPKYYDKNDNYEVKKYVSYSMKYYLLISIPTLFGISILSYNILVILTTPEIATQGYLITPIIALGFLLLGIYVITSQVLLLKKKTKIIGFLWILSSLINIFLNFILIPYFGIAAAATITTLCFVIPLIFCLKEASNFLVLKYQSIAKFIIASVIVSVPIYIINPKGIFEILIIVIFAAIFYLLMLLALKVFKKKEIDFLLTLLKR